MNLSFFYILIKKFVTLHRSVTDLIGLFNEKIQYNINKFYKIRGIDMGKTVKDFILPSRIVYSENARNCPALLCTKPMQIGLNEGHLTLMKKDSSIVLDFGKEICGGVRILTFISNENGSVRLRLGESVAECCAEIGEKGASNDHSLRDIHTKLVNYSDMEFMQSGFRFLRVDNLSGGDISIKSIYAASVYRNLEYKGTFECDDVLVNQIFDVARYTCHLNMQNMLWDGIKRDRLVWIGDTHPEMLTIRSVFGSDECIEEALTFAKEQAPLPLYMNNMPTYSLWWICILYDYYMQNENTGYIGEQGDYLEKLVRQFDELVDEDGTCHLTQYFLDWATNEKEDAKAGVMALFIIAIENARKLLDICNSELDICDDLLGKLRKKSSDVKQYKQALAFKVLSGETSAASAYEFLTVGGAKGMTTFLSYYTLKAVAMGGNVQTAIDMMKEYYGGMLQRGATSFWEDFDIEWLDGSSRIDELPKEGEKDIHGDYGAYCYKGFRHSLCHGWSSGVVPFLMEKVIGIEILEAGCKKVKITPDLGELKYAKATYPTPFGIIKIEIENNHGEYKIKLDKPPEIIII